MHDANRGGVIKTTYMKRVYFSLLAVACACIITFFSCRKSQEASKGQGAIVLTTEGLAKDEPFIKLNDAINRFDPKYLQLVYKDNRTTQQIVEQGNDLLIQLNTNPESILFQTQLADFYHFTSVVQLKEYSAAISENLKKLDAKYDFQKTLFKDEGSKIYYAARKLYAKQKLDDYPTGARKKTNGLWTDFVDEYFSTFGYISYVYDEGFVEAGEGGGDPCYDQLQICRSEAGIQLFKNIALYAGSGALVGGKVGASAGTSVFPGVGSFWGALGGALGGGILGASVAYGIYSIDLDICKSKYNICIDSRKTKQ